MREERNRGEKWLTEYYMFEDRGVGLNTFFVYTVVQKYIKYLQECIRKKDIYQNKRLFQNNPLSFIMIDFEDLVKFKKKYILDKHYI